MDEMKDKMKGFMKKMNNSLTSSSSSGKFKGQGRVLGSSSSGAMNPIANRANPSVESKRNAASSHSVSQSNSNPKSVSSSSLLSSDRARKIEAPSNQISREKKSSGFDPFDSLITSSERSKNGYSLNVFECPVCGQAFRSEEEVSVHIETCIGNSNGDSKPSVSEFSDNGANSESVGEIGECVGAFVSGGANEGSMEVVLKLLWNIIKEPENSKFRRIRMSNPKIREAIGEVVGGVELMECVGFRLQQEGEDMWAAMEVPSQEHISLIRQAISLLEPNETQNLPSTASNGSVGSEDHPDEHMEPKKIDRQIRVFFSVPESVASQIVLPDSFYSVPVDELKSEADSRKKKIAESQLLIPKSYKEKQAKATKKRYKTTVIRIQFPDEVVLTGHLLTMGVNNCSFMRYLSCRDSYTKGCMLECFLAFPYAICQCISLSLREEQQQQGRVKPTTNSSMLSSRLLVLLLPTKRPRDLLNPKAVKYMQSVFSVKDAVSKKESREISALCGVTVTQVREFFSGQRARVRKFVRLSREINI